MLYDFETIKATNTRIPRKIRDFPSQTEHTLLTGGIQRLQTEHTLLTGGIQGLQTEHTLHAGGIQCLQTGDTLLTGGSHDFF